MSRGTKEKTIASERLAEALGTKPEGVKTDQKNPPSLMAELL
jgi:hypothetical protein